VLVSLAVVASLASGCARSAVLPAAGDDTSQAAVPLSGVETVAPEVTERPDLTGLQAVLDEVAAGFLAAEPERIRPHLHDPESAFGRRWLERAANLTAVPLSRYALELDDSLPDLATTSVRETHGEEAVVVYVREEHALEGFDSTGPATEDLFLTAVRTDGAWRFAGDRDAEPLGLVSADHLWDHGPVVVSGDGPIIALHHPDTPAVDAVLAEARAALDQVIERWPLPWSERVPVIIPRDEEELAELLHVTFDLSSFVAFATSTPVGELGDFELTGARIVVNPPRFLNRSSETRQLILAHELLHVATRPSSGPFVPAWVEEGIAQRLGEQRSTTGLGLLQGLIGRGGFDDQLPDDSQFTTGGRDRIFLSYQTAFAFIDWLVETYSDAQVAEFYRALGRGAVGEPGTEAWHVDRAAREVFGAGILELRAAWRDALGG
jgi:hypothetical protein